MQMEIRWRKMCAFLPAECLHRIPCLFHVWKIRRGMSDTPETMGGLSGVPNGTPLHRQYKTARTETRRHLLLKIRQMPSQTSASRGYVFVRHKGGIYAICCLVPIRDTHKSPTNCLPGCRHDPRSTPNLERHGSSKMQTFGWLEIHIFEPNFKLHFHKTEIPKCISS